MEKEYNIEGSSVLFAIPAGDCRLYTKQINAILQAGSLLRQYGVSFGLLTVDGHSILPRARNNIFGIARAREPLTHVMLLDDDVIFNPYDIVRLLCFCTEDDVDVVCGAYPMRDDDMEFRVHNLGVSHPELPLVKVGGIGFGFMMMKKKVIDTLWDNEEKYYYDEDVAKKYAIDPVIKLVVDFEYRPDEHQYIGEDILFCLKAMEAGYNIWCDPSVVLTHNGLKGYTRSYGEYLEELIQHDSNDDSNSG